LKTLRASPRFAAELAQVFDWSLHQFGLSLATAYRDDLLGRCRLPPASGNENSSQADSRAASDRRQSSLNNHASAN
jgi:hypothetical protein